MSRARARSEPPVGGGAAAPGARPAQPPPADTSQTVLMGMLELAVPMWIDRVRCLPAGEVERRREHCLSLIGYGTETADIAGLACGERGPKRGKVAAAFNAVAEALAILAFCPGGVTFAGSHWEAS